MDKNSGDFDSEEDSIFDLLPMPEYVEHPEVRNEVESFEDSGNRDKQIELIPEVGDDTSLLTQPIPSEEQVSQPSPSKSHVRRASSIQSYISSPSAKRFKTSHCHFCKQSIIEADQFELHLRSSDTCSSLYKRKLKVRSIESVLVLTFYCLFCKNGGPKKFPHHLEQSTECFNSYCQRYNVGSIR